MDLSQSRGSIAQEKGNNGMKLALDASQPTEDANFCARCDRTIPSDEKDQHEDWHFAKDLQAQETAEPQANDQPPQFAPPPYPPPNNAANRAVAIRHHTNQVTEAAKVRARDEVHFCFILM